MGLHQQRVGEMLSSRHPRDSSASLGKGKAQANLSTRRTPGL